MASASDVTVEIIKVIGSVITTFGLPYMAWRIRQVEKNTNSLVSKLIKSTEKTSEQLGKDKEQSAQKAREENPNEHDKRRAEDQPGSDGSVQEGVRKDAYNRRRDD